MNKTVFAKDIAETLPKLELLFRQNLQLDSQTPGQDICIYQKQQYKFKTFVG